MTDDGLLECQICGKCWRSLGHHVRHGHGISPNEYRDRFGIRRSQPLTSPATRARFSVAISDTIETGGLVAHFATNGDRAKQAGQKGAAAKRLLRAQGVNVSPGAPHIPLNAIAAVVAAIESGARVATAVKRTGISYSAYHAGLARFPDLKVRHDNARRRLSDRLERASVTRQGRTP